jgi:polar amino acid transport system substrate-binding protein
MSQRSARAVILGLLLGLGGGSAAAAAELRVVVGSWCPFECTEQDGGSLKGFLTDIAVAVLRAEGVEPVLVYASYRRGIQLVMENRAQVLVGVPREDAPGLVFPEVEQGLTSNTFFVRAESPWRYRGASSLGELAAIGIVKDFDYGELGPAIAAQPGKFDAIAATFNDHLFNARRNIEKLLAGRVDAIVHDALVTEYELKKMGKVGEVVPAGSLEPLQRLYVAFSPLLDGAQGYAERMSRGTEKLRASGELAAILERYGLRDWRARR